MVTLVPVGTSIHWILRLHCIYSPSMGCCGPEQSNTLTKCRGLDKILWSAGFGPWVGVGRPLVQPKRHCAQLAAQDFNFWAEVCREAMNCGALYFKGSATILGQSGVTRLAIKPVASWLLQVQYFILLNTQFFNSWLDSSHACYKPAFCPAGQLPSLCQNRKSKSYKRQIEIGHPDS